MSPVFEEKGDVYRLFVCVCHPCLSGKGMYTVRVCVCHPYLRGKVMYTVSVCACVSPILNFKGKGDVWR